MRSVRGLVFVLLSVCVAIAAGCGGGSGSGTTVVVSVALAPSSVVLAPGHTQQFVASVGGAANTAVYWTTTGGTITSTGLYTAPSAQGVYSVVATSQADATRSATALVQVVSASSSRVYQNGFEGVVGPEWTRTNTEVSPTGRRFLGRFGAEAVALSLTGIGAHSSLSVTVDLYVIGTWDGNASSPDGPDTLDVAVVGVQNVLHASFSNVPWHISPNNRQSYPGRYPGPNNAAQTGAAETSTLGYMALFQGIQRRVDAVYRLNAVVPHTGPAVALAFTGSTTEGTSDESWGIDNVDVWMNP
jgi:hypothetical protein